MKKDDTKVEVKEEAPTKPVTSIEQPIAQQEDSVEKKEQAVAPVEETRTVIDDVYKISLVKSGQKVLRPKVLVSFLLTITKMVLRIQFGWLFPT